MIVSTLSLPPAPPAPTPPAAALLPAATSATPVDSTALSGGGAAPGAAVAATASPANPWPELERLGLVGATAAVPGPLSHTLTVTAREGLLAALQRCEAAGVTFERQRGVRVPGLMDKYVPLSVSEMADAIEGEPSEFKTQFNANVGPAEHVHLQNLTDLQLLDAYIGLGPTAMPARAGAVEAMHDLEAKGWKVDAFNYAGPYDSSEPPAQTGFAGLMALVHRGTVYLNDPTPGRQQLYPRPRTDADLIATGFFEGSGPDRGLADPALAQAMKDAAAKGLTFRTDANRVSDPACLREAYLAATIGNALRIEVAGQWNIPVTPDEVKNLTSVEPRMKVAEDLYTRFAKPSLANSGYEFQAPDFVNAVLADTHGHDLDLKAKVMAVCVRAEAAQGAHSYAVDYGADDLRRLLNMSTDPGRVLANATHFAKALKTNDREHAHEAMQRASDEMRALAGSDAQLAHVESLLAQITETSGSLDNALETVDLVRINVGSETEEERLHLYLNIAARQSETADDRSTTDYRAVLVHRLPNETLLGAGARMVAVLDTLSLTKQQERAAEVFAVIQEGTREGRFGQRSADDTALRLGELLVTAKSLDDALDGLSNRSATIPAGPSTVETGEDYVIIGGVKVPRSGQP